MDEGKKITAPQIDRLLRCFDRRHMNPSAPSRKIIAAMEPLFSVLEDLAPLRINSEAKSIWLEVPRGISKRTLIYIYRTADYRFF